MDNKIKIYMIYIGCTAMLNHVSNVFNLKYSYYFKKFSTLINETRSIIHTINAQEER